MSSAAIHHDANPGAAEPGLRWLIGLLQHALGSGTVEGGSAPPIDADSLADLLQRHRVGPFLFRRLRSDFLAGLPPAHQAALREADQRNATLALVRSAELVRIARRLEAAGIRFVSVKGPLLARSLYGEVGARHSGDLDLLVHPDQVPATDQVLRAAGYRRSLPAFELSPRQWIAFQQLKHEFEYLNESRPIRLEIEWRLSGLSQLGPAELISGSTPTQLAGTTIARLPETLEFLYLFVHGAGHAWFRLFWLVDVSLLLLNREVDWHALMRLARQHRVETCVWQGARLAECLFGIPIPSAVRIPLEKVSRINGLTQEAWRRVQSSETEGGNLIEMFRELAYQVRVREGWKNRTAVLRPLRGTPENWRVVSLPDSCFALYTPLAPALWAWRRLRRAKS
jgi:hypothetical protein